MHRWEDDIRMDFKEIGINTRDWGDSAQGKKKYLRALVYGALNLRDPYAMELVRPTGRRPFRTA